MAKAKLNFRRLSVPEKIAKAKQIVTALTGNADFPNPVPPLATLTTAANSLETTYNTAQANKQTWKASLPDQATAEDALDKLISQCQSYVESVAGTDEGKISSVGMEPKGPSGPSVALDPTTSLEVANGDHDGELDLNWDRAAGAKSYLIQQSLDPNVATGWTQVGASTKSSITISGLTSGTRYWFRVAAVGAKGQSGWSDPAMKIAP